MMSTCDANELVLLPGTCLVMFLVRVDQSSPVVAVAAAAFLDGLRAANALVSFSPVHREDLPLEDLLPWAGGV